MNVVEQLKQEIVSKLNLIENLEQEIFGLQQALEILEGSTKGREVRNYSPVREPVVERLESPPREVRPPDASPERLPKPIDTRLPCPACGGRLEPGTRSLQNGKVVNLLMCTDSGCNHEQF